MGIRLADQAYDNAQVAALYSQLTGVLAGFAFAALVLVLTRRLEGSETPSHHSEGNGGVDGALGLLFSAFIGLALSSLAYAVIAGETTNPARASLEHVIAGAGFGVSAMVLMLALLELLIAAAPGLDTYFRIVVGVVVPLVVLMYTYNGVLDLVSHIDRRSSLPFVGGVCVVLLVVVLAVAYRLPGGASPSSQQYMVLATVGSGIPLVSALVVPIISTTVQQKVPTTPAFVALLVILTATAAVGAFCAKTR